MTSEGSSPTPSKPPSFRWVVLLVFAINGMLSQIYWINFASINSKVALYYGVATTEVDLLSLMFMVVYLIVGPIASLIIDSRGFRVGAGIGVVLTGGFGFLRCFATDPSNFALLVVFQIGIAAGQPFLYNAISKVAARWFPPQERATASGIANLGFYVGILLGFILPPLLWEAGLAIMMVIFGILGLVGIILFIAFGKDHPETPYGDTAPVPMKEIVQHLKNLLHMRIAIVIAVIAFIGVGAFNAISTFIQYITGVTQVSAEDAGLLGGLIIIMGIIGSIILPAISDNLFKAGKSYARKLFLILGMAVAAPIAVFVGIVPDISIMYLLMAIFGFFLLPVMAIGMQWIAEETAPVPESQSNNLLMYAGQIGGILFILLVPTLFNQNPTGTPIYSSSMYLFAILFAVVVVMLIAIRIEKKTNA